ncbi:MAG: uroporphyrinogen decarboxylase family protein [Verrucomicrobiota bacterium]
MTRRAYVEAALQGRQSDRVPCFPLVDVSYASTHSGQNMARLQLDPRVHALALAQCARELPIDGVYINLCLGAKQAAQTAHRDGQYRVRIDDSVNVQFSENDVAAIASTDICSLGDERIQTAGLFHPGMLETFQAMTEDLCREVAVFVGLTGAFSQVGFLLGLQNLMLALMDEPAAAHRAIRQRQQVALGQAREICQAGARFIWIGEGMASSSLLSPQMYAEFVLPYEQELADEIRRLGALSLLHICGNITPALAQIAQSRVDGVDVDAPTDWPAAVSILGPHLCLKGNINPLLFLPGKGVELRTAGEIAKCIGEPARSLILSTGCLVPRDSAREAFSIMAGVCNQGKGSPLIR